jgi:hypothetical protein
MLTFRSALVLFPEHLQNLAGFALLLAVVTSTQVVLLQPDLDATLFLTSG